ncbi:MAG: hypothetical protein E7302_11685 [Butyrivibrio sp.]|nr:hypothetical protein [Butyrivibrio sp.]
MVTGCCSNKRLGKGLRIFNLVRGDELCCTMS